MAGSWNTYALGFRERVFFVPEVTFGVPAHPAATDATQIIGGTFDYTQERVNRNDKTSSRSYRERMTHRKSVNWNAQMYLLPSGTNQIAPDASDVLEKGLGTKRTVLDHAVHATTPCTTRVLTMAVAVISTDYVVGDAIAWLNPAGDYEVSFVTSVTAGPPVVLGISPGFSGIPAVDTVIKGSITYKLANNLGSLTITRCLDNCVDVFSGCVPNTVQLDFPGDGEGMLSVGGAGKTAFSSGCGTMSGALTNVATALYLKAGDGVKFSPYTRIQLEEEVLEVTAVASNVALATVGTVTATPSSGGSNAEDTFYYKVTAVDADGREGTASAEVEGTTAGANLSVTLTWTAIPGASAYKVYKGTTTVLYDQSFTVTAIASPTYVDNGTAGVTINPAANAPTVNATSVDRLTVTRGQASTSNVAHATGLEVGPYEPPATVAGSPVSGTIGDMIITGLLGARTLIPVTTTQVTVNNQVNMRNNQYGTDSATGYTTTQRREVNFSTTMWLTKDFYKFYNSAKAFTQQEVLIQLGKSIGRIVAAKLGQSEFNIPAINGGGAEEVMVPITGVGLSSAADNDEIVIAFL